MSRPRCLASALSVALIVGCAAPAPPGDAPLTGLHLDQEADRLVVRVADRVFTEYRYRAEQKYPYFFPVIGPASGQSVTTETSEPYPHHHSLFFACDRVNGGNYWQEGLDRGQIVQRGVEVLECWGARVRFRTQNVWQRPGAAAPFADERTVTIDAPAPGLRRIVLELRLTALVDVVIEKSNHALFAARMAPALAVRAGGHLVNAEGAAGEVATFGARSAWMTAWGERDGQVEGLTIVPHPENRWSPSRWFTRDYGFLSPTPMYWLEGDRLAIAKGSELALRYCVLVHAGGPPLDAIRAWLDTGGGPSPPREAGPAGERWGR